MELLYKDLSTKIYDSIFSVHRALGPGLLESAYEICLKKELEDMGLWVETQKSVPLVYKGIELDAGYRVDLMIDQKIILELKAVETIFPVHRAQLLTYLKLTGCSLGFLVNFNVTLVKDGITRMVLERP
jgi:GxxExxY protein